VQGPSGNHYYFTVLTGDSSATVQADTFEVTPDGSCIIFQTISVSNNPSQSPLFSSQALYKTAAVTSINIIGQTVATPTFTPPAGSYISGPTVTIADATGGATIYYTTDGSTPTTSSPVYSTPVTIVTLPTTLQAVAVLAGYINSAIASALYIVT
jgi:hypothetical protein